jgi:hypothetical protein
VVLLSCHGSAGPPNAPEHLFLHLKDGVFALDELIPEDGARAPVVLLSACKSGVYELGWGDYPVGGAPALLRAGVRYCAGARFEVGARFAAKYFRAIASHLAAGRLLPDALAEASVELEEEGADLWTDLACIELVAR